MKIGATKKFSCRYRSSWLSCEVSVVCSKDHGLKTAAKIDCECILKQVFRLMYLMSNTSVSRFQHYKEHDDSQPLLVPAA